MSHPLAPPAAPQPPAARFFISPSTTYQRRLQAAASLRANRPRGRIGVPACRAARLRCRHNRGTPMIVRAPWLPLLALSLAVFWGPADAQDYPNKPIKFIVPYPPGGGTDVIARILQEPLAAELGPADHHRQPRRRRRQCRHRPRRQGAGRRLHDPVHAVVAHDQSEALREAAVRRRARLRAGEPRGAGSRRSWSCNPSRFPSNNVQGADRATPRRIRASSITRRSASGRRAHIAGELFKLKTGVDIVHVPYKGGGPAVTDTIGGQVQLAFVSMPAAWQHVKAGRLQGARGHEREAQRYRRRTCRRSPKSGVPDYVVDSWYGALAPAKTPPAVIAKLNAAFAKVLDNPQVKEKPARAGRRGRAVVAGGVRSA